MIPIERIWPLLGGVALFIFSINFLVLSMQSLFGEVLRGLNAKTVIRSRNSFLMGLLSGASVLSVYSCTNMILGLVNSGIVKFSISALFIMGVNLGASIFPWLFTFDLSHWSYLFLFIGAVGHFFIRVLAVKLFSRVVLGVGFLYLGLDLCINFFNSDTLRIPTSLVEGHEFLSLLIAIILGVLVSYFLNSTVLLIGLFMAFFYTHNISVELSCAVLAGASLGPCIKLYLNSKKGNIEGQRSALFNIILNSLSIPSSLIYLTFFSSSLALVQSYIGLNFVLPFFYTVLNAFNIIVSLVFFKFIREIVFKMIPTPEIKIPQRLIAFGRSDELIPATALWQGHKEMYKLKSIVDRMFDQIAIYISDTEGSPRQLAKIKKYEDITDRISKEMEVFIRSLMENTLNSSQAKESLSILFVAKEFEAIADYLNNFVTNKTKIVIEEGLEEVHLERIVDLLSKVRSFYEICCENLGAGVKSDPLEIRDISNELKEECENLRHGNENPSLLYSDMIISLRKVRSHCYGLYLARLSQ
ncbi:Na/Pi symporter [Halobacteriovorax marinus]|uniref:Na/Pi symporter n=1 Tax=Halobacteriovorax marinus TaxID=97084 RepID=UPI003A923E27